ncbi:MAG: prepilin-type N-terminal cleavage/methylation domain-containing protein [Deltaproteobacteria bacterium]|nr:prepilin-type N-terminal cleavage/methylation domain-containing protein [Deltaproteobacteria bacterium]
MKGDGEGMKMIKIIKKENGITLIELLVALVIFSLVIAGTYRLFIAQSRAHTVQERVVETQQTIRSAMEILLRDLRMTGFDSDSPDSKMDIVTPLIAGTDQITIDYEFDNTTQYSIRYRRHEGSLKRQLTTIKDDGSSVAGAEEILLENVEELNFTYGVDTNDDFAMEGGWVQAGATAGLRVVAIKARLTARPQQLAPEDQKMMSPRTLETAVTLRNLCMR